MRSVPPTESRTEAVTMHDLGGEGSPLVICHATGFCGHAYLPLADELRSDFRVWAVDLRGHGRAGVPADGDFSYAAMAADLVGALDGHGLSDVVLVGHSMGGAVGLLAAGLCPDLFRGAYVFEPAVLADGADLGPRMAVFADEIRQRRWVFASRDEARGVLARKAPYSELHPDSLAAFVEHGFEGDGNGSVRLCCAPESEARCYELNALRASDYGHVDLPVVVACGTGDLFAAGIVSPAVTAALPAARAVIHQHLGHFGPLEDPALIGADIRAAFGDGALRQDDW